MADVLTESVLSIDSSGDKLTRTLTLGSITFYNSAADQDCVITDDNDVVVFTGRTDDANRTVTLNYHGAKIPGLKVPTLDANGEIFVALL